MSTVGREDRIVVCVCVCEEVCGGLVKVSAGRKRYGYALVGAS